jgi:hypothetical protein
MTAAAIGPFQILGAQLYSTHHASAEDLLAGRDRPATPPAYRLLAGRARRFTSLVTQLHIEVCGALTDAATASSAVFATCHGEIQTAERLVDDFRQAAMVSSARFALSVHNTASGVYAVATGSNAPTTTVTGGNAVAAGWLEAVLTALDEQYRVLLSIADEPVPEILRGPSEPAGIAAAFLLAPVSAAPAGRRATLAIAPCAEPVDAPPREALGRAVAAIGRGASTRISLGQIQPGAALELQIAPEDAPAREDARR